MNVTEQDWERARILRNACGVDARYTEEIAQSYAEVREEAEQILQMQAYNEAEAAGHRAGMEEAARIACPGCDFKENGHYCVAKPIRAAMKEGVK